MKVTTLRRMQQILALLALPLAAATARAFDFDDVAREAQSLAAAAYRAPAQPDPKLVALSYDGYRNLRFKPDAALWHEPGTLFDLRFYPLGRGNSQPLRLFEIADGAVRPLEVAASNFRLDNAESLPVADRIEPAAGAAGWRLNFPLNDATRTDELISFLGSSYFRALGSGQRYGLSARGLAVDSATGRGEEFPVFTTFWLRKPAAGAREVTVFALLDSPSAAGAYRFIVRPGKTTTVDVQARLFPRGAAGAAATFGLAPLTSMFLSGENQPATDDYRPEVHDSDGLQLQTAEGEWLWRPLTNPRGVFTTSFALRSPRGFGLMQRDRAFTSYEDLEAAYELRPSVWVEPLGDWGAGRVELLQFGTPNETHDNVVAYWVPERASASMTKTMDTTAGSATPAAAIDLAWRLHWSGADAVLPPGAHVMQSRLGHGYREAAIPAQQMQFHIDFAGANLSALTEQEAAEVEAPVSGNDNVRKLSAIAYPNPVRGGWRVTLSFERIDPTKPVELRAYLRRGQQTLSETWSYALAPA